jgi:hypothetical protein
MANRKHDDRVQTPMPTRWPLAALPLLDGLGLGLEAVVAGRDLLRHLGPVASPAGGLGSALRGAGLAALVEVPVALVEEGMAVQRGEKPLETAVRAAAGKVASAAVGGGIGAGVAHGLGSLGVGSLLAPIAPVLLVAGGATVAFSSGVRLHAALQPSPARVPAGVPPAHLARLRSGQVMRHEQVWVALPAAG